MNSRENLGNLAAPIASFRKVLSRTWPNKTGFLRVLAYHDIPDNLVSNFENQIRFAAQHYNFIDFQDFKLMISGKKPIVNGNILLTFDDGFKSNYKVAKEILIPMGIHSLFFIVPGFPNCKSRQEEESFISKNLFRGTLPLEKISREQEPMTWSDLKDLVHWGQTIGAHSLTHANLAEINDPTLLNAEIVDSKKTLEAILGTQVQTFAYPFGNIHCISPSILALSKEHYEVVFSAVRGNNPIGTNPYAIRRESVCPEYSIPYFRFILEGGLSFVYRKPRRTLDSYVRSISLPLNYAELQSLKDTSALSMKRLD